MMPTTLLGLFLAFPLLNCLEPSAADAQAIDRLDFGDPDSERVHALETVRSEAFRGGLDEPARRLLPLDPVSYRGGSVAFDLKVDPERQNYLTVKLWGSDCGDDRGRLLLFMDGMQVGYRHEGDHDVLNQCDNDPLCLGRFFYQTVALPRFRTAGRAKIGFRIEVLGRMWPYGQTFALKQRELARPSRGIYEVCTHTNVRFEPPAGEKQGPQPEARVRPSGPVDELLDSMKATVNQRLGDLLDQAKPKTKDAGAGLVLVAEAYHIPWTVAYRKPEAVATVVRLGDAFVGPGRIGATWNGAGPLGEAIARLGANPLLDHALDESVEVSADLPFLPITRRDDPNLDASHTAPVPSGKTLRLTRREVWTRFLRASVDWNRTQGRRPYTNQSMIVDYGIYTANRGLAAISPERALTEQAALRYLRESAGILPWLGNDTATGSEMPYGADHRIVTRKALSRELGWVASYGETILKFLRDMAELSGDPQLRAQLVSMHRARLNFRYPALDAEGFRTMRIPSEIDNRTAHFPMSNPAYGTCDVREDWWMTVPAFTKDAAAVGATQQCLADNQYHPRLARRANDPDTLGMMRNIGEYATVKSLPPSTFRIPAGDGQPDFVFADEENAVIAMKHGDRRLFVNFYYRQERGVSGSTRILETGPDGMRVATVLSEFEVDGTGDFWQRPDHIDFLRTGGIAPPGETIHQAWAGEKLPIAKRPPDARLPAYGNWGPFVGKAAFYHLRYGDYLFAVNTTTDSVRRLTFPSGIASATDLVTGRTTDPSKPLEVPPLTTVVLHLRGGR